MKFRPLFDIWEVSPADRAAIQPGQWVQAGPQGPVGQYMGQKRSGTDVVAWRNTVYATKATTSERGYTAKRKAYRQYATAI
jgi:hypothetical protein